MVEELWRDADCLIESDNPLRRRSRRIAVLTPMIVALVGLAGCAAPAVAITISPDAALVDEPFTAAVTGLSAGEDVTLRLETTAEDGDLWSSSAVFAADGDGTVTTAQAPVSGDYSEADPMGLVATLTPGRDDAYFDPPSPWTMTLSVLVDGTVRATATTTRTAVTDTGIRDVELRPASGGVYADTWLPATDPSSLQPAVLVIGGSEGGIAGSEPLAQLFAAHGIPAMALAYFHEDGLPDALQGIPLEYFSAALTAFAQQPGVDPSRITILGISRGSEAALLTAAHFPSLVSAVIASVPASEAHASLGQDRAAPAWTLGGQPIPAAPQSELFRPDPRSPAAIPVEDIAGPILMVCGVEDEVWPSCIYAQAIQDRLRIEGATRTPTLLTYADAGHFVGLLTPYHPSTVITGRSATGVAFPTGGTAVADNEGRAQTWPQVLAFVQDPSG